MGHHIYTLTEDQLYNYFHYVYAANVSYCLSTALIKVSILIQYLRLFSLSCHYAARRACITLLVIISCWGTAFFFISLLGCTPIAKNWDMSIPGGQCVMFGSKNPKVLFGAFVSHASSNMFFDLLVWILPIPFFKTLSLHGKQKKGVIALISVGIVVTILSAVRLFCLTINRAGTYPVFDPSWYAPPIFIFSSLEVETAILCASIPIFWPIFKGLSRNKIFVTHEVEVRTERRNTHIEERELGYPSSSEGSSSTTELARHESEEQRYYKDSYVAAWVLPGFEGPGDGKRGHTATAERAEKPFDYLNFELDKR